MDKQRIAHNFSKAAPHYEEYAFLQKEIAKRLVERMQCLKRSFSNILDLGSGTGLLIPWLKKMYPKARITGVDIAYSMTQQAQKQHGNWFRRSPQFVCADFERLPFSSDHFDLVISNCSFQWSVHIEQLLKEIQRVSQKGGCLFFSSFGPDTLIELRNSFSKVDSLPHVHDFLDMHILGDRLVGAQFIDPVIDREDLKCQYSGVNALLKDLKMTGANNLSPSRPKGLFSPRRYKEMLKHYPIDPKHPRQVIASFELIFGHGICTKPTKPSIQTRIQTQS